MGFFRRLLSGDPPPERARKMRRNERCWCGSGKKYKRCHWDTDRVYFSRELASTCRTGG